MLLFYALVLLVLLFDIILFASMIVGAPYVPSRKRTVEAMIKKIPHDRYHIMADLGAGDGRIVVAFAKAGFEAHGFEINPFLVVLGKYKIARASVNGKAFMHWRNLWSVSLTEYDTIVIYGIFYILPKLVKKFEQEITTPTLILSEAFQLPGIPYTEKADGFYVYELPLV